MLRRTTKPKANKVWHWLSVSNHIDGLLVGTWESGATAEAVFRRIEGALGLIKAHDRLRYERLVRDLERVRVWLRPDIGSYNKALRSCELDSRYVLAETSTLEMIASTIVHEATHARLMRRGIGYETDVRARVEMACVRRQIAFAAKLPNGGQVRESAERSLELCSADGFLTDTALEERYVEGCIIALRHLGVPNWLVHVFPIIRSLSLRICRGTRSVTRAQRKFFDGLNHALGGNHTLAIANYDKAIRLDPKLTRAYFERGNSYGHKGDHGLAIANYDEAIRLDSKLAGAYWGRGNSYSHKGDRSQAIADYDKAIRLDPKLACVYFERGKNYGHKGDHTRAITDYDEAIRLDPKLVGAYFERGKSYWHKGDHTRALSDLQRAENLEPTNEATRSSLESLRKLLRK